jgi:hypothetical protein
VGTHASMVGEQLSRVVTPPVLIPAPTRVLQIQIYDCNIMFKCRSGAGQDCNDSPQFAREAARLLLRRDSPQKDKCSEESQRNSRGSRTDRLASVSERHSTHSQPGQTRRAAFGCRSASVQGHHGRRAIDFGRSNGAPARFPLNEQETVQNPGLGFADEAIAGARPSGPDGVHPAAAARALGLHTVDRLQEEHLMSLSRTNQASSVSTASRHHNFRRSVVSSARSSCVRATPW